MTTVGKAAYDLLCKPPERILAVDMQREMQKSTLKNIEEIVENRKDYADEYFIVLMLQKDRVIPNLIRQKFIVRKTRPAPDYDTTLYRIDNRTSNISFEWTIPDEARCEELFFRQATLSEEDSQSFSFVKKFAEGTLV